MRRDKVKEAIVEEDGYRENTICQESAACFACMEADGILEGHFRCGYPSKEGQEAFKDMQKGNRAIRLFYDNGWLIEYPNLSSAQGKSK